MVNPVVTLLFDVFLIGSALTILAAMVQEHLESRRPAVGGRSHIESPGSSGRTPGASVDRGNRRPLRKVA